MDAPDSASFMKDKDFDYGEGVGGKPNAGGWCINSRGEIYITPMIRIGKHDSAILNSLLIRSSGCVHKDREISFPFYITAEPDFPKKGKLQKGDCRKASQGRLIRKEQNLLQLYAADCLSYFFFLQFDDAERTTFIGLEGHKRTTDAMKHIHLRYVPAINMATQDSTICRQNYIFLQNPQTRILKK